MSKGMIGLDIGGTAVRAVELGSTDKRRPLVEHYAEVPLPEGAVRDGTVVDALEVSRAIKQLWNLGRFSHKRVALGVGNKRVLVRDLSLPMMPAQELRESLAFQVQDLLPVAVTDALLDFYPVSQSVGPTGAVVNGLLVAAIKDAVRANIEASQIAGLDVVDVDLLPFAVTRTLATRGENSKQTVALVDIGAHTTNVAVVARGVPQFARIISSGGADITGLLANRLEVDVVEAEQLKRAVGLVASASAPPEAHRVAESLNAVVAPFITSLRDTLAYYNSAHPQDGIRRILLSGAQSQLPGFVEAFAQQVRIPTSLADPLADAVVGKRIPTELIRRQRTGITVALGLALGDVDER